MSMIELSGADIAVINRGRCPHCLHRGFVFGPRGGMSTNIECANVACRSRFNVAQFSSSHAIVAGHTIPKQDEGGSDWGNAPA